MGRSLINGGGVFPDLEIQDDTLTLSEREFIRAANEAQFPLRPPGSRNGSGRRHDPP